MKFSITASLLVLLGVASALPADLEIRAVKHDRITLKNAPSGSKVCGGKTYSANDILIAAQYGTNLHIAKETRGKAQYPHPFDKDDSKGNKLTFPKECPADKNRYEYPLANGKYYDGGKSNKNAGDERVVFYYEDGEIDNNKVNLVYYCGIMTHKGAPTGGFKQC
ncbi:hypothetical protein GQ44DRAFT_769861 [Phaeosphaeriaceae sp. PMI808]|nr:hypothetical protein GQ44DRAFT_769861 [Phaeosphaeriaceae sp. PMI808]